MGKYFFQNGSVYFDALGKIGVVSREEFAKGTFFKDKTVQVLVNNVEFRTVTLSDVNTHLADELVAAEFPSDQIVQYEKVSNTGYQGMAVPNDQVAEIYRLFDRDAIKVFIPYPVALRAFVNYKNLFDEKKVSVVVDDLQDRFVLTIFWGLRIADTREIPKKSIDKTAEEVIRSEKYFITNYIKEISNFSFMFISNNKELCEALSKIDGHTKDKIAYFEELYPAFLALDIAKFPIHFYLPDEIIKQRRIKDFKRSLISYAVAGAMAGVAMIFFLVAEIQEHLAMDKNIQLNAKRSVLIEKIKSRNSLVYKDILKIRAKINLFSLYGDFIRNVPPGHLIENFSLSLKGANYLSGEWEFIGHVLSDKKHVFNFGTKGMFKDRSVENIFINDMPAQRVVLTVAKSKGE